MRTTTQPYLIRAIYEWILDNGLTPYLAIDATCPGVELPETYVEDGRIVLNISEAACRGLHLDNEKIIFTARFAGVPFQIVAPPSAVMAIYAKENGQGMMFAPEDRQPPKLQVEDLVEDQPLKQQQQKTTLTQKDSKLKGKGHLTVIK